MPLAVEFGKKRSVIGFDINKKRIEELKAGRDGTLEITEQELNNAKHLYLTTNPNDLKTANCFIVTVPTPIDKYNRPNLMPLVEASKKIGEVLKSGDIIIYESTVYPGATEEECVPILEKYSKMKFNQDFFVVTLLNVLTLATRNIVLLPSRKLPRAPHQKLQI